MGKKLGLFSVAALLPTLLFAGHAVMPTSAWSGLDVGLALGSATGNGRLTYTNHNLYNTLGAELLGNHAFSNSLTSFTGGATLAYRFPVGPVLLGLEGRALTTNMDKTESSVMFPASDTTRERLRFLSDITVQLGLPYKQFLGYIGAGWAGADTQTTIDTTLGDGRASSSIWLNGWALNAGVNYRFTQHFYAGVEYGFNRLYVKNQTVSCPNCGEGVGLGSPNVHGRFNVQTWMAKVGYVFGAH